MSFYRGSRNFLQCGGASDLPTQGQAPLKKSRFSKLDLRKGDARWIRLSVRVSILVWFWLVLRVFGLPLHFLLPIYLLELILYYTLNSRENSKDDFGHLKADLAIPPSTFGCVGELLTGR